MRSPIGTASGGDRHPFAMALPARDRFARHASGGGASMGSTRSVVRPHRLQAHARSMVIVAPAASGSSPQRMMQAEDESCPPAGKPRRTGGAACTEVNASRFGDTQTRFSADKRVFRWIKRDSTPVEHDSMVDERVFRRINTKTRRLNATARRKNATARQMNASAHRNNATARQMNASARRVNASARPINATTRRINATTRQMKRVRSPDKRDSTTGERVSSPDKRDSTTDGSRLSARKSR